MMAAQDILPGAVPAMPASKRYHLRCMAEKNGGPVPPARFKARSATPCAHCGSIIAADEFYTWERTPGSASPAPAVASPAAPAATPASADLFGALGAAILPHIQAQLIGKVDAAQVAEIAQSLLDEQLPIALSALGNALKRELVKVTTIEVRNVETGEVKAMGVQHKNFATLLKCLQARKADGHHLNVWMTGPTGSGKTTSAAKAAEALGMRFGFCGAMDTSYQLLGYKDAHGNTVQTEFRDFFTNGGVYLLDEIDSWSPSALLALNAALANGMCAFPDGTFQRHPEFICLAAANTWGMGATSDYVGRCKLDAAFLARFACKLNWPYDEVLELALAGNADWCKRVQEVRANVVRQGLKIIVNPRIIYEGAALLDVGLSQKEVEDLTLRPGLTNDQWEAVR